MNYFTEEELTCKCGCGMSVEQDLVTLLNIARASAGVPFVITSGARCEWHNKRVGGKEESAHTKGLAVDIATQNSDRAFRIMKALMDAGFKRIGWNQNKNFIHVDIDHDKPFPVLFKY